MPHIPKIIYLQWDGSDQVTWCADRINDTDIPYRRSLEGTCRRSLEGTWPEDDIRRAFVAGAQWWEDHTTGATMWSSDRCIAEDEAERRYPDGNIRPTPVASGEEV